MILFFKNSRKIKDTELISFKGIKNKSNLTPKFS